MPHVHPAHIEAAAGAPTGRDRADRVASAFPIETNDEGATSLEPLESVDPATGYVHRKNLDVTRKEKAAARRPLRNRD